MRAQPCCFSPAIAGQNSPCHRAPMAAEFGFFTLAERSPSGMEFEQSAPCTLARCLSDRICKLLFSLCLLLAEGWFRSGWWDGKIALTLALSVLMRLPDRLDTRFRPRSRPPVAARNRESGEIAVRARPRSRDDTATLRPGIEPAHVALANQRATVLLLENLSDEQRRMYKIDQHFFVIVVVRGVP